MFILILASAFFSATVGALCHMYWNFRRNKNYWRNKKVPYKEPRFLFGNFQEAGKKNLGVVFRELYEEGKNRKYFGVWQFTVPVLLVIDLDLVKSILVADFPHFDDHGVYFDEKTDPLAANLLTMGGSAWRSLRAKLNPAFSAGKLKAMFPIMLQCGEELARVLRPSAENQDVVEFKDLLARFTTDVISSCAFGIEANSLKDDGAIFRAMGKKIRIYPKTLTEFFVGVTRETMNYREENNVKRNDILQMLIQLKNEGFIGEADLEKNPNETLFPSQHERRDEFSYEQAAAQAFIFFTAGFETSSTTMQYALYELAANATIQDKVRTEMRHVLSKSGGTLTYDAIQDMVYLGRVLDETLRKYPPATNLNRVCTKEYKIPGTDVVLDKGTQVSVSVLGLHWDDRYYPQPQEFDPERFAEERKASRPPCAYMPFGEGPRTCIGQRFGLMQTKIGLVSILLNFQVSLSKETQVPPVYDPKSFFSAPKGGMHLKVSLLPEDIEKRHLRE